ncbi:hypothetical protein AAHA92_17564 [Salvia divinorum]|uniref:Uncharacterized protein n=1 Tax=Salvia divinorum TaxID=28513 RepID=A0ABD1H360_SALDI
MKMTGTYNADVECGEEADQLGIRLMEVERLLEQEEKSQNKAEKGSVEDEDPYCSRTESPSGVGVGVDNSMAIVPVEIHERETTVKQVLESLRRAKEHLQRSMVRRSMRISTIKVG